MDKESFESSRTWITEFRSRNIIAAPILIAATKLDTYNTLNPTGVSSEFGQALAQENNAKFIETSAFTGQNVEEAFRTICE